jgi:hypothetical protein
MQLGANAKLILFTDQKTVNKVSVSYGRLQSATLLMAAFSLVGARNDKNTVTFALTVSYL